ncbi:hypothetical protein SAMN05444358_101700 [Ruegeria halocynthiae]|uniref:Uncharacterized protein n=1 Tax=Ruegeria halocynthiae TaxID=985054 RepID=A0A1H2T5F3_9RHOB|nr:hypothetical protein [Ruegeria halocynthiae]SDW39156.1 hypothetical protein SAMN05444358_101700 [Ruegeria halocynthiae]
MTDRTATFTNSPMAARKSTLDQRIKELRAREPVDINHGEALLLQGIATASLRKQLIAQRKIDLD